LIIINFFYSRFLTSIIKEFSPLGDVQSDTLDRKKLLTGQAFNLINMKSNL